MQTVVVLDDTLIEVEDLVGSLKAHGVVVLNSVMRGYAQKLKGEAVSAMRLWNDEESVINYLELQLTVAGEISFVPTMFFSRVHSYGSTSPELVGRAMEAWVAKGTPSFYLYKDVCLTT
ncbi:hypothetical protein NUH87_08740 [Pseudomonas batumici]|uniref:hypothetical protein n=1 Tax=Pseudomonas batumici TaxID=226910 RepID=UPI0030D2270C